MSSVLHGFSVTVLFQLAPPSRILVAANYSASNQWSCIVTRMFALFLVGRPQLPQLVSFPGSRCLCSHICQRLLNLLNQPLLCMVSVLLAVRDDGRHILLLSLGKLYEYVLFCVLYHLKYRSCSCLGASSTTAEESSQGSGSRNGKSTASWSSWRVYEWVCGS